MVIKFISHRGNLHGPDPKLENKPPHIIEALNIGFDVEVDVFFRNKKFYLGHDHPQYEVSKISKK
jgi:hypothetical protein